MIAALLTALAVAAEECGTEQCDASQVLATCGTWCPDGSTEAPKGLFRTANSMDTFGDVGKDVGKE